MRNKKVAPRNVPPRDDFYMGLAFWLASKSKDPSTQCGAIVISKDNEPLGTGYNGPPRKIRDTDFSWDRSEKYSKIIHAEKNAIWHSEDDTIGATLYVTAKPCSDCMIDIVKAEISRVIYFPYTSDSGSMLRKDEIYEETENLAELGNVHLVRFTGNLNWMRDRMKWMESQGIFGEQK